MSDKIRVAYLSHDGLTDPLGQSQILPYILGLEKLGYEFTIFSLEKRELLATNHSQVQLLIQNRNICWKKLVYHRKPPIISTLWDIYRLWQTVNREHIKRSFQIIHCRSYVASLVGLQMKKKYGIKFLFDMRGFWVDERVEGGLWNLANPLYKSIYKYFKKKEKAFIESADHIISLTENAKSEIELWKLKAAQISVIPTCVDIELFNPKKINHQEKNALKKKLGIGQDDFVLIYLGSWGTWYLTDEMLRFYAQLKKRELNAKFLIISADAEAQRYRGKDIIVRRCNRSEVPAFISIANLSVAFVQPTYSKKASSATKIGEIIAMGIPVVTNQGWGDIQTYNNQGVTIATNFDEEELDMSIVKAMPNAANERNTLLEKLSLATGIKQYLKVYEGLSVTF